VSRERISTLGHGNLQPLIKHGSDTSYLGKRQGRVLTGELKKQLHPDLICGSRSNICAMVKKGIWQNFVIFCFFSCRP
jgi:hypothetical protein